MPEAQIDAPVVIATNDKKATTQARKVLRRFQVADRADRFKKLLLKIRVGDAIDMVNGKRFIDIGTSLSAVVLDVDMPNVSAKETIAAIRAMAPDASMLILASDDQAALEGMRAGAEDYLLKPIRASELATRIRALEERKSRSTTADIPAMDAALPHLVERLHNPANGQLDAKKVADFFGLTVAEIARLVGRGVSTVHKTPSAPTLQESLRRFESVASGLLRLTGSDSRARMWLNASNPDRKSVV